MFGTKRIAPFHCGSRSAVGRRMVPPRTSPCRFFYGALLARLSDRAVRAASSCAPVNSGIVTDQIRLRGSSEHACFGVDLCRLVAEGRTAGVGAQTGVQGGRGELPNRVDFGH